ncbi:MAG: hypothetical protein QXY95_02045 [Thermosphaera sp.]
MGVDCFMTSWRDFASPLALIILAAAWTARFLLDHDVSAGVIGLAFILGSLSYLVHVIAEKSSRNGYWRMLEAGLTVSVIAVVVAGYVLTGSPLLMILSALLIFLILLGLALSYLAPRMRREV